MNVQSVSLRRRWTPYKIVETVPGLSYEVFYLFPREQVPDNAYLFVWPIDNDGPIHLVRDAAARLMLQTTPANKIPA